MLLSASHVGVSYGRRVALAEISLTLDAGQIVALLGPNGSGKSTLLRALLGQLPANGSIQWQGKPIGQWPRRELARGCLSGKLPAWEPGQTVGETLLLGRAVSAAIWYRVAA